MSAGERPALEAPAGTTVTVSAPADVGTLPAVVHVVAGPDRGKSLALGVGEYVVGTAPDADLVLQDPTVSRRHLCIRLDGQPLAEIRDLGSRNGSLFAGVRFQSIRVGAGAAVVMGETTLRLAAAGSGSVVPSASRERFGDLVGTSEPMRQLFTLLERVAQVDSTVLIEGETGVGKELVAMAIHQASRRRHGPFVVFDAGAVPPGDVEVALFGRAADRQGGAALPGLFDRAAGGTLLLDGVGELDPATQPRLLRAVERKEVKPVGSTLYRAVDVRVMASSNRSLEGEVQAGRFRQDLYHRLAVTRLEVPPLRQRREDVPFLVDELLGRFASAAGRSAPRVTPEAMLAMTAHDWPGNVRQLRNVLEQAAVLIGADDQRAIDPVLLGLAPPVPAPVPGLERAPTGALLKFKDAKDRLVQAWEREYLEALLARTRGNVSLAARRAGLARPYLHELLRKHDLARE